MKKYSLKWNIDEKSKLFIVKNKITENKYFCNVIKTELTYQTWKYFKQILNGLSNYNNPVILNTIGISPKNFEGEPYPTIITEYASSFTLKEIIQRKPTSTNWTSTTRYINLLGIAFAMKYIQENRIPHLNLDPDNIYLDKNYYPKLFGFNFLDTVKSVNNEIPKSDSIIYIAPENFTNNEISEASDVYSFGMIAYILFTGNFPKLQKNFTDLSQMIQKISKGYRPATWIMEDKEAIQFLEKCWAKEKSDRYTFDEIVDQLLNGKFQTSFKPFDKGEVDRYIELFAKDNLIKRGNNANIQLKNDQSSEEKSDTKELKKIDKFSKDKAKQKKIIFLNKQDKYMIRVSSDQTVADIIKILKEDHDLDNFDLFLNGKKLDQNILFFDAIGDSIETKIEIVPNNSLTTSNDSNKPSSKRRLYDSDDNSDEELDFNKPIRSKKPRKQANFIPNLTKTSTASIRPQRRIKRPEGSISKQASDDVRYEPQKISHQTDEISENQNNHLYKQIQQLMKENEALRQKTQEQATENDLLKSFLFSLKEKMTTISFIDINDYEFDTVIGTGGTSTVQIVNKKEKYAQKELKDFTFEKLKQFISECEILFKLRHPCIIRVYGFSNGDENHAPSIILSLEPTSLEKAIQDDSLDNNQKNRIIIEIVLGMRYIHKRNFMHRDLKPLNILLSKNMHVRISDFGLAKEEDLETSQSKGIGTVRFMAPELFVNEDDDEEEEIKRSTRYTNKVDVYSFGITLIYIITEKYPPFKMKEVVNGTIPKIKGNVVDWVRDLIVRCLSFSPDDRPSFSEIFEIIKSHDYDLFNDNKKGEMTQNQINAKKEIEKRIQKIEAFEYQHQNE